MTALISIIIPIYNVEEFLTECLESVQKQSYQNIEVLLIDDGSFDSSVKICEDFVSADNRFRLVHQENQGQSVARNHGLDLALGDYIIFIDSDDTISRTHVETLYQGIIETHSQVAMCRPTREKSGLEEVKKPAMSLIKGNYRELLENEDHSFARMGCWCKIYAAEILKDVRFPAGILHQDNVFFFEMLDKIEQMALVHTTTYHYRRRANSAVQGGIREKNFDLFKRNQLLMDWFSEKHPECLDYIRQDCLKMNDGYARKAAREQTKIAEEFFDRIVKENESYGRGKWARNKRLYLTFLSTQRNFWRARRTIRKLVSKK
ncbi:glycosyltransferase family 2 protein [Lactococcus nasutitermitis]|uniref:Glycosyltransferase family 2 protein n=1 Tax=Lactococcus nasutitermitis TaxID=1652957 RepID=A0ABV9JC74_9LACT|nr:glycosyltransferase family 2 protein [Lactococcus nasutitermitis]